MTQQMLTLRRNPEGRGILRRDAASRRRLRCFGIASSSLLACRRNLLRRRRLRFSDRLYGRHRDLEAAYDQLLLYREALENPPLLVVNDILSFPRNLSQGKNRTGLASPRPLSTRT